MKPVKTFVSIAVLLLALAVQAPAGEQQTPGAAQPSPTPNTMTYSGADDTPPLGDPYSKETGEAVETLDYLWFEALTALIYLY